MPKAHETDSTGEPRQRSRRTRYPNEFKRDIAMLVLDQKRSVADVAKEFDLIAQTVANWVRAEKVERGERSGLTREEREEMAQLRRDNKRLTIERDLLKKATVFWIKESTP
jgi:transposase